MKQKKKTNIKYCITHYRSTINMRTIISWTSVVGISDYFIQIYKIAINRLLHFRWINLIAWNLTIFFPDSTGIHIKFNVFHFQIQLNFIKYNDEHKQNPFLYNTKTYCMLCWNRIKFYINNNYKIIVWERKIHF